MVENAWDFRTEGHWPLQVLFRVQNDLGESWLHVAAKEAWSPVVFIMCASVFHWFSSVFKGVHHVFI